MNLRNYKTDVDALLKKLDKKKVDPSRLVSDNASKESIQLFEYIKANYTKRIISGQQYLFEPEYEDIVYYRYSGRLPAMKGYDFMDDTGRNKAREQTTRAIRWAKESGGIVTMCWHWYVPKRMDDKDAGYAFYREDNHFDLIKAVTEGTPEYELVIDDIDCIANSLRRLEDEGVAVLWRPLHEANGAWFWWGNVGKESIDAYKKLWYIIFDRLENLHKLTNLIWVWNGQSKDMAVHPNTYDIVGEDIYPPTKGRDHSSQKAKFDEVTSYTHGKMATLSECGFIPDPDNLKKDKVYWSWWLPWWGQFVHAVDEDNRPILDEKGMPTYNENYLDDEYINRVFNDDYVITLDDLPWFDTKKHKLPPLVQQFINEGKLPKR